MTGLKLCRRAAQILVILLFCLLPWLNLQGFAHLKGTLFAFDFFGLPFADPASVLQALAGGAYYGSAAFFTACAGAAIALGVAFFLGRVFCGWLCPYGFFSELVYKARQKLPWKIGPTMPPGAGNKSFALKIIWLLAGIAAIFFFAFPLVTFISMPGQLSLVPVLLWNGAGAFLLVSVLLLPLCLLVGEFIWGRRLWCAWICPQSLLLGAASGGLPKKIPGLRINWKPAICRCGSKSPCRNACSVNLNPRAKKGPSRRDCMMCGDCVSACRAHGGALAWSHKQNEPPLEKRAPGAKP